MKWILYTFTLLIVISSCKSVQELVDKGDYDGAIYLAAKKLHGKKNKKTCLLYTSPSPRDQRGSRMPSSA